MGVKLNIDLDEEIEKFNKLYAEVIGGGGQTTRRPPMHFSEAEVNFFVYVGMHNTQAKQQAMEPISPD